MESHSTTWSLTHLAVKRPIATLMACGVVLIIGLISLDKLSVDLMPDMSLPTLSVVTVYPGAGPEEIETLLTRPIEQALSSVTGVDSITSESMEGSSTVRVRFIWGRNLDAAMDDIRQKLDRLRNSLPEEIEAPYVRKYDTADSPIILMGLSSDLSGAELTTMAEQVILPRLEQLNGVAQVRLRGREEREIQIELDRARLQSRGIGVNQVLDALQAGNVTQPAGDIRQGYTNVLVRNRGEFYDIEAIRDTVVVHQQDAMVRVRDIATVVDGLKERTELTRVNGQPALMVYIFKQAGANTVTVSDEVHRAVENLNTEMTNAKITIRQDKSDFIREAITNIRQSAVLGMGLATIVLILFLQSLTSTLIIAVVMPFSVIATFALMYFQGFTLNIISFGGLALGIGLLVDNSIVVLESIFRRREQGMPAKQASIEGTNEVAGAIIASTVTTLIVFFPLLFVTGITGLMLHQLAWVVSFSLACSLVASLTLTPVMAAYCLPQSLGNPEHQSSALIRTITFPVNGFHALNAWWSKRIESGYGWVLHWSLRFAFPFGFLCCVITSAAIGLYPLVRSEFLPETDEGVITTTLTMSAGMSLEQLSLQAQEAERRMMEVTPELTTIAGFIGGDADDADRWNRAYYRIRLVPRNKREATAEDIRKRIEKALVGIPGTKISVRVSHDQLLSRRFGSSDSGSFSMLVSGHDPEISRRLCERVVNVMEATPGLANVEIDQTDRRPELSTQIDRTKASLLNVSVRDIGQVLETTLRGTTATTFREDGIEIDVVVRLQESDRKGTNELQRVSVTSESGQHIPLTSFVRFEESTAPVTIERLDQQRTMMVSADLSDRALGEVVADIQSEMARWDIPQGYTIRIGGDWEEKQESFETLRNGFLLALLLMYMVMASQFESFRDPLVILVAVPLALVGVMIVFAFFETSLNVQSFIGCIVLAGIIVNNAIVVVDYLRQLRQTYPDKPMSDLIEQAGRRRFRPILMTTLTTVLAMIPIAIGWGDGGELQAPMARVVIGGLVAGTVMTLFVIPLIYLGIDFVVSRKPVLDEPELVSPAQATPVSTPV